MKQQLSLSSIPHSTDLAELEAIVGRGRQAFLEVALALYRIRDARLYKETHQTFEDYCKDRWGWGRDYAYKLIKAGEVAGAVNSLSTTVDITSERQARELARAGSPEEQADAWKEAVERSAGAPPTAAVVREVVEGRRAPARDVPVAEVLGDASDDGGGVPGPIQERAAVAGEAPAPRHALLSSESNEWYTPEPYVDAARRVMGGIDLDPASCDEANAWIKAKEIITAAENGLVREWRGRVWLNCPYGRDDDHRSNQAVWTTKLLMEHAAGRVKQAHLLVNSATGNRWFRPLWGFPICFVDHRIKFRPPGGLGQQHQPTHSSVVVYLGVHRERFVKEWAQFGHIVVPGEACSVSLGGAA